MLSDLRYAFRQLVKSPGFTIVAVLTLGLGVASTTIVFGLAKALVIDPFPYPQHEQIAFVWSKNGQPLSSADYVDLRSQMTAFSEFGVYRTEPLNLGLERPEPGNAAACTAGVLRALGIPPALGRLLNEADEKPGAPPVVVISYSLWQRALGADPLVIGKPIRLNQREHTVVGVMPANFEFISPWHNGHDRELWVPLNFTKLQRDSHGLLGLARLKPGVTVEQADAQIKAIGQQLSQQYPETNLRKPFLVRSVWEQMTQRSLGPTLLLFGAVALLLLVACANVAGLLLARTAQRQNEFGVRLALGATKWDIVRLVMAESSLLAALAAFIGLLLASGGIELLKNSIPSLLTTEARRAAIALDPVVAGFGILLTAATVFLFGVLPAFAAAATPVLTTLKEGGRNVTGGPSRNRFLRYVVIAQITLALVLAHGAMLLSASYIKVLSANEDLNSETVLTARVELRGAHYPIQEARVIFWNALFERVRALPGVEHVAIASKLPLEGGNNFDYLVDDQTFDAQLKRPSAENSQISPEYFDAMGIPILRGRAPTPADVRADTVGVAINQRLAERSWPGQDPLGRRIHNNSSQPWFEGVVVGVVGDVRQQGPEQPAQPEVYFPYAHQKAGSMSLVIRTAGFAGALVPSVREAIAAIDPDLPVGDPRTLEQVVRKSVGPRRLLTYLSDLFTITALLVAMVGIYGTLSYTLVQQRREIGIRITLGALHSHILTFVFRQAGVWAITGLVLGSACALALAALLKSLVYGISPFAPWSLFVAAILVSASVAVACLIPARRATRVDPIHALRSD